MPYGFYYKNDKTVRSLQRHKTVPGRRISSHVYVHVVVGPIVRRVSATVVVEVVMGSGVAVPAGRTVLRALPGPGTLPGLVSRRVRASATGIADVRHPLGDRQRLSRLPQFCRNDTCVHPAV